MHLSAHITQVYSGECHAMGSQVPETDNKQVQLSFKEPADSVLDSKVVSTVSPKPNSKTVGQTSPRSYSKELRVLLVDGAALLIVIFQLEHSVTLCVCVSLSLSLSLSGATEILDSESSLKMMKMLLKKLNVVADTAENGRIAVDMVMGAAEPYHLLFMDNLMPEMVISFATI